MACCLEPFSTTKIKRERAKRKKTIIFVYTRNEFLFCAAYNICRTETFEISKYSYNKTSREWRLFNLYRFSTRNWITLEQIKVWRAFNLTRALFLSLSHKVLVHVCPFNERYTCMHAHTHTRVLGEENDRGAAAHSFDSIKTITWDIHIPIITWHYRVSCSKWIDAKYIVLDWIYFGFVRCQWKWETLKSVDVPNTSFVFFSLCVFVWFSQSLIFWNNRIHISSMPSFRRFDYRFNDLVQQFFCFFSDCDDRFCILFAWGFCSKAAPIIDRILIDSYREVNYVSVEKVSGFEFVVILHTWKQWHSSDQSWLPSFRNSNRIGINAKLDTISLSCCVNTWKNILTI